MQLEKVGGARIGTGNYTDRIFIETGPIVTWARSSFKSYVSLYDDGKVYATK